MLLKYIELPLPIKIQLYFNKSLLKIHPCCNTYKSSHKVVDCCYTMIIISQLQDREADPLGNYAEA